MNTNVYRVFLRIYNFILKKCDLHFLFSFYQQDKVIMFAQLHNIAFLKYIKTNIILKNINLIDSRSDQKRFNLLLVKSTNYVFVTILFYVCITGGKNKIFADSSARKNAVL